MRNRLIVLLALLGAAGARPEPVLHVAGLLTKGYVVGAPVHLGGLVRHAGDTLWAPAGPQISRVNGIAFDPANPAYVFLACGNGALRTLDGGRTWRITTDWRVTEVNGVALDAQAPDRVYLASAFGVWRTEDRGETWTEAGDGLPATFAQVIRVDRRRADHLLVATERGLARSTNGARRWTPVGPPDVAVRDVRQSASDPNLWLAATAGQGVLRSRDGGATWQRPTGLIARETLYAVALDPSHPGRMAAAGWNTGVYVSTDGGATWTPRAAGLPVRHVSSLAFDPVHPGRLWAGTIEAGLYRTDDLGARWAYAGLNGGFLLDLAFF